ncbi:DUF3095 domain-containing protein [Mucilaginibacter gynuensis]|uniref:DUF3095 domain-containing protein n=1 Tax=Mucilaginibacter gynuensis TaxID=1302236 RepID=A0ABP8G061_9SPHI
MVATGSIVTVLNLAYKAGMAVPFFFGGDGATFILPPELVDKAMPALLQYKQQTMDNFGLNLRIGTVRVADVYEAGYSLQICKFCLADSFPIPIVLGDGLNYAESIIKGEGYMLGLDSDVTEEPDLTGMQCRWDKIPPPENKDEVVTLLVIARNSAAQSTVFCEVMRQIDDIYGSAKKRQPISVGKLKFKSTFNRLGSEMRARLGEIKFFELVKTWAINLYSYIWFRTEKGKDYLNRLVEMSDTLVIDGKINTVISGTKEQRAGLQAILDGMEKQGDIYYGLHVSGASIMSCYVRDLEDGHIHFVDGAEGGYTRAATVLKAKIKAIQ